VQTVNVHEAKTRLSQLLTAAEAGEEVIIARQGVAVARLVPIAPAKLPEAGAWRSLPGWEDYVFDPAVLAALETDEELREAGWPV